VRFYTHIAGSVLSFLIFAYGMNLPDPLLGLFFAAWISVFPDIIDRFTGKHRGWGHSIFWLIPLSLVTFYNPVIGSALVIGFVGHLLLDIFTVHGCPLLYPLRENSFVCLNRVRRIKTGSNQDKSVLIFIVLLILPLLIFSTPLGSMLTGFNGSSTSFATDNQTENNSVEMKSNININLQVSDGDNKNITMEKVNDTVTTVLVKDVESADNI
jgi:inner membrane protein